MEKIEWTTVRVLANEKVRLQRLTRRKANIEDRTVTEGELATIAIAAYCRKEEKRLGIKDENLAKA